MIIFFICYLLFHRSSHVHSLVSNARFLARTHHLARTGLIRYSNWGLPPPLPKDRAIPKGNPVLGVDFGTIHTGVAVSRGWAPRGLLTLDSTNDTEVATQILKLARGEIANTVVVGLPLNKAGRENFQTKRTREFAAVLAMMADQTAGFTTDTHPLEILLVDERFTSMEATARLQHKSQKHIADYVHIEAACGILESYFEGTPAELVTLEVDEEVDAENGESRFDIEGALEDDEESFHGIM